MQLLKLPIWQAVYQFSVSALRNIIGQHTLDEVLPREREQINGSLQRIVDTNYWTWELKLKMVEMKDVEIPEAMQGLWQERLKP